MALSLVTAATQEPVSVDEQKEHLRFDGDDDDAYIASCISAARQWIEGQTKRALMAQTWDYGIDYIWPVKNGSHIIELPLNPVAAQGSPETIIITYVDEYGSSQALASTQYIIAARTHNSFIVPAHSVTWPAVRWAPDAITVRFVVGSDTAVPLELKRAVMILAGHYYENRETTEKAPESVEALISPFRAVTFR